MQPNQTYQVPLNVYDQAFKSAQGVPLPAGYITFSTVSGSAMAVTPRPGSFSPGNVAPSVPSGGFPAVAGPSTMSTHRTGVATSTGGSSAVAPRGTNLQTQSVGGAVVTPTSTKTPSMGAKSVQKRAGMPAAGNQ